MKHKQGSDERSESIEILMSGKKYNEVQLKHGRLVQKYFNVWLLSQSRSTRILLR